MKKYLSQLVLIGMVCGTSQAYCQSHTSIANATDSILKLKQIDAKTFSTQDVKKITDNAKWRLDAMQSSLQTPSAFIKFLLPAKISQQLPSEIQPYIEHEVVNIEGTLEILAAIYATGNNETTHYLLHQKDKTYQVVFADTPPENLQTDMKITIKHAFQLGSDNTLIVSANDIKILKNVSALPLSFGPQKILAILVNFSDKPTFRPWTVDEVRKNVFTDMNNLYGEMSYGQSSITGQLAGWFVVNIPSTQNCNTITNTLPGLADQAATAAGISISQFPRKMYIFPNTSSCTWAGLGTVGGANTRVWMNGYATALNFVSHEVGHNVGLGHASALNCPTSPIDGTCTVSEYSDATDTMGNIYAAHFNAYHKDRLGWLNYQSSPPITTVTQSGSYFIDAYETNTKRPKALKILKRAGGSDYYYLELRQPIGFDAVLSKCGSNCDFTRGIVFHQGNPGTVGGKSQLLDMTPGGTSQKVSLLPCQSWRDAGAPNGGITFTVQSVSANGARVKITYGGLVEKCEQHAPSINVAPFYTPWLLNGERATYALTIKNNDNKQCKPRQFAISLTPAGNDLVTKLTYDTVTLSPGASRAVTVSAESTYVGIPAIRTLNISIKNHDKIYLTPLNIGLTK